MGKDYYQILGIPKDASNQDIRKAYKELAKKHHPDKGGDQEKFKELSQAYEVLNDEEKKRIYDQFGEEGVKQGGGPNINPFAGFPLNINKKFGSQGGGPLQKKKCEPK